MDQPPRATAAQMASRNIKQAKRKARVVGHLETPRDSVPQFSTLPTQTGLFGGQLQLPAAQSSTDFNFSVAQNPVFFPSSTNSAAFNSSNLANAQPVPSPKKAPSALGQNFTINWPTSTTAGNLDTTSQSVVSPQKAPSALGQNFTVNWPAASEQPAVNQGAKPLVEATGENGIRSVGGLSMPSISGQSQQTPSGSQKIYGESKWALGDYVPPGVLDPIPDKEKNRPRTAEELELDEVFPPHLYGPGGPLAPAFPYEEHSNKTSEKPSQQIPAKSYVFGQPNVSSGSVGQSELAPPTSNALGQSQPTTSTSNIFGKVQPASTSNIFGLAPTNNILGNPQPTPPTSNLFGQSQPTTSTSNIFGQVKPAPTSNVLGTSQPASASNIFGQVQPATTNNAHAQSQPAPPASNIFGQSTLSTNSMFGSQQTTSTGINFGNSLNFSQTSFNATPTAVANTNTSINGTHTSAGNNIFNPSQKTGDFGIQQFPTPFNPSNSTASTTQTPAIASNNIFGSQQSSNSFNSTNSAAPATQTSTLPSNNVFGSQQSSNLFKSSNEASKMPATQQPTKPSNNLFASLQSPNLLNSSNEASLNFHASATSEPTNLSANQEGVSHTFPDLNKFSNLTDEAISTHMPVGLDEAGQYQFRAAFRLRALNIATATALNKLSVVYAPTALFDYVQEQRRKVLAECKANLIRLGKFTEPATTIPALDIPATTSAPAALLAPISSIPKASNPPIGSIFSSTPQSKRKHTVEDDEDQENRNPSKRTRNIEEPTPKPPSNHTPRINNEQATPVPSTRKGKRRAEDELNQDTEQLNPLRQKLNGPSQNGIVSGQSNTSNILRGIIESPAKETPRKIKGPSTFSAKSSQPTSNPFGVLPVPSSQGNGILSTNAPQLSTLKDTSSNLFSPKPTPTAAPANLFSPKPASTSASVNGTASQPIKPPVFGTGAVNFLAQFGQKASADEKDNEAKLMEKAKAEDMDSDEDEKEWEAKWKATRREQLKKLKESSKSKKAKFVEGRGFVYDHSEASDSSDSSTSTNFKATGQETSSLFNSPNPSRQSTPGLRSNTGSVLDGNSGPIKTEHNIFGNLSSKGSGSEDADDDDSDGENGHGEDSENINPSHQSGQSAEETSSASARKTSPFGSSSGSGISGSSLIDRVLKDTDGKPVRSNSSGDKESSETSTPKRSLFDRIDKDDNGKPIRSFSNEEKENTQPTAIVFGGANNPFASSLNKSTVPEGTQPNGSSIFGEVKNPFKSSSSNSNPVDQTWKPNSPIKFGQSTTAESAPTVSVTAATPPKSQSPSIFGSHKPQAQFTGFGNLTASSTPATSSMFGNSSATPTSTTPGIFGSTAPSNLFGSSTPSSSLFGATKLPTSASVGFAFGGNSATSSLFPSATGSADTSRATSPAGTTDNDSGVENDPDAEKHEQIDLTAGGPGEENENVVFEVRSKLMKFDPKDKQWPVQGLGPLRVLKHKETGAARIVMRADPSGKLLLNKAILPQIYEANGKTMKLTSASDSGKGLETYLIQVKEPEMARKLAEELNANKN